jgi:competence protein ComEA
MRRDRRAAPAELRLQSALGFASAPVSAGAPEVSVEPTAPARNELAPDDEPGVPAETRLGRLAARLPEPLRGGVVDPRTRGAWALAGVAVLAAVVAGAVAFRARPHVTPVAAPVLQSSTATPRASAAPMLIVDVAGKVRRPGLQHLPTGSRVADAVAAAGGARPGTDTSALNLARKLVDGEQIFVGAPAAVRGTASSPGTGGPVNLNSASLSDFEALAGVGPVLAGRIVAWRDAHGSFTSVDQLREVDGIGERKFASLSAQVTV